MDLNFKLQTFEGPLDLLLHLIDKNKVDIYDIPIVMITEQYMEYIKQIGTQDLNMMSEFLVMAATLLDIKCKMLLPKECNEDGEEEDPRAELIQKLIEYKMYKYMAYELRDKQISAKRVVFKDATFPKDILNYAQPIDYEKLVGDMDLSKLNQIFKQIMRKQEDKVDKLRSQFGKIEKDEIDLEKKTLYIENYVKSHDRFSFRNLMEEQATKMEVVVTFLVILELIKMGRIITVQDGIFNDIIIISKKVA